MEKIEYECVKEIAQALRKAFKGIQANSYGYCCTSDYDANHKYTNENDFVCARIYKGGNNNSYVNGRFRMESTVWFIWNLTQFKLPEVISVMQEVADRWGYKVITPESDARCIRLEVC